jgi:hypothetical protein
MPTCPFACKPQWAPPAMLDQAARKYLVSLCRLLWRGCACDRCQLDIPPPNTPVAPPSMFVCVYLKREIHGLQSNAPSRTLIAALTAKTFEPSRIYACPNRGPNQKLGKSFVEDLLRAWKGVLQVRVLMTWHIQSRAQGGFSHGSSLESTRWSRLVEF